MHALTATISVRRTLWHELVIKQNAVLLNNQSHTIFCSLNYWIWNLIGCQQQLPICYTLLLNETLLPCPCREKGQCVCVQRTSLNPHILTYSTTILLQHSNQKCHWPRGPVTSHPQSYRPCKWFLGLSNAARTWSRAIPYPEVSGMGEPSDIVSLTMTQLVGWFGFQMNDWQNIVYEDFLSPWSATFCDL